ncbi:alpha-soluble NSF attachment protein [Fistulifera solaris]|uniref:Alpha-soluble NSF attachment protein n=1 Tax=Fistulifera solaris TaxID=1519565 RepID=A0A1Z5JPI2_FISSO|nr:alpha-soluble NSF attachment protein [Fistulifera solaris]|eukprot:GAX15668.1 alpha-soluble NSF attachment protein [Fistulifera solaris]
MSALAKSQKAKAETFVQQAEATLNKKSWFSSSKERNQEDAAETYLQAANAYKVGGWQQEAGDIYCKAGEIYRDLLKNPNEAAKAYSNAGSCYKKSHPADAVSAYQSSISLLTDAGRLSQAAKLCKECAELYESEEVGGDANKSSVVYAIEMYEQAAELFTLEDAKSSVNQCNAKIAELCSAALDPPDLLRASQLYEDLGRNCLDSNLLKFNAKGYFLQAVLCHLANNDAVGGREALSRFEGLDYTFSDSREGKFATQLVDCVEGMDAETLATACFEYDRISKLDPWKTSMLVKVKRSIEGDEGGNDEDDFDLT